MSGDAPFQNAACAIFAKEKSRADQRRAKLSDNGIIPIGNVARHQSAYTR